MKTRIERDQLGTMALPAQVLHGIHTARAVENFGFADCESVFPGLIRAYGTVKQACIETAASSGRLRLDDKALDALLSACGEMTAGQLDQHIVVPALAGGAGTSLNMNVNEVLANRALVKLGLAPGQGDIISPTDHVNIHQSTNDTFPTALKLAAIIGIQQLEQAVVALQETFQQLEQRFAHVVKLGRTQLMDAVPTTVGRQMGAYADALSRDRWRIYKSVERLRVVNLGGTAIGTGLGAPRKYIFEVTARLAANTGIGFARGENMVETTQNADVFSEVSGLLKTLAATLVKICGDLRFMASGPDGGIGELTLPARQAGSSIMPGKVNPVIPEAVTQAALQAMGQDDIITNAVAMGHLELNPFLPLVAHNLLGQISLLTRGVTILRNFGVTDLTINENRCRNRVMGSAAVATAFVGALGYDRVSQLVVESAQEGRPLPELIVSRRLLSQESVDELLTPEAFCRLGDPE